MANHPSGRPFRHPTYVIGLSKCKYIQSRLRVLWKTLKCLMVPFQNPYTKCVGLWLWCSSKTMKYQPSIQQAHKLLPFTVRRSAIQQIALRLANAWMRRFVWSLDSHAVPSCAFSKNVFDLSCWDLFTFRGLHSSDIYQSNHLISVLTTVASSYSKVWIVFGYLSNAALPGPLHL